MKKTYIIPAVIMKQCDGIMLLSGSRVSSNNGIKYGGTDNNGSLDPNANSNNDFWDDEE